MKKDINKIPKGEIMDNINKCNFIQSPEKLFEYGIIRRKGYWDNRTDCEVDYIFIHIPSKTVKRFHGTFYDDKYIEENYNWIIQFPKDNTSVSVKKLQFYYNVSLMEILKEENK